MCTLRRVNLYQTFSSHTAQSILQLFVKSMAKSFIYQFLVLPYTQSPRLLQAVALTNTHTHVNMYLHSDVYAKRARERKRRCRFYIVHLGILVKTSSSSLADLLCIVLIFRFAYFNWWLYTFTHSVLQSESVNSKYCRRTCVNKCENKRGRSLSSLRFFRRRRRFLVLILLFK